MPNKVAGGYSGRILRVNLSQNITSVEEIDEQFCRKYIGGAGFVTYYLWKELEKGIDALDPRNKLIFAAGPVTGVALPGSGRNCVGCKSPLTGGIAKSEVGGVWGAEFRHAGYDAVIIEGKAAKPVYLCIQGNDVSIRDASHLWGKNLKETEHAIKQELGDDHVKVAGIGPAENLVRYACIINDLHNAAGRGGTGAVMGSKNLKAIAVRGQQGAQVAAPDQVKDIRQWMMSHRDLWVRFFEYGTGADMTAGATMGNLPVRNFTEGEFPDVERISAQTIKNTIRVNMGSCYACPIRCKKVVSLKTPYDVDPAYGGPEYETLAAFGSNCGISDLAAVAKANELCNAYGLDTISTGDVVAFAMECFENGMINPADTGGVKLNFGNHEAMLATVEMIARRQGIGNLLAEGVAKAAKKIGKGTEKYAMHVKGLEIPMHEPRVKAALGLGYAVNPHGADHCANLHDTMLAGAGLQRLNSLGILRPLPPDDLSPAKVSIFRYFQQERVVRDCLTICMFVPYDVEQVADILKAVTGWKTGVVEMLRVAERVLTMARLFNIREGFSAADDVLPARFFQPKRNGVLTNAHYSIEALEKGRRYYYSLMGWDVNGVPTPEKLADLGIA